MATDIDIEEHDVLQSSKAMGIFPNLSLVKTEALSDDEQDNNQHLPTNPEAIPDSTTGYDSPLHFERVSESPHVVSSTQEDGTTLKPKIIGIQSTGNFFNNLIVLGQKPTALTNVEEEHGNKSQVDNGTSATETLSKITPNESHEGDAQDELQMLEDTALEAVNNCIMLGQKPGSEPAVLYETDVTDELDEEELMKCYSATVTLDNWGPYLNRSDSYCRECEILFATVNALDAHKMLAHSFLVAVETKDPVASTSKAFDPKKACFVCQKSFKNHSELIQHIYHHVSTTQECSECNETFLSQSLLTEHMKSHAKPEAPKPKRGGDSLYRCKICGQCLGSLFAAKRHIAKAHSKVNVTSEDYMVVDMMRCATCDETCHGIAAFNAHSLTHNSTKSKDASAVNSSNSPSGLPHVGVDFVPKSTLFSCSECDTHFTSLAVAFSHQKSCPETRSQDCQQCPLAIASACIERHRIQHMFADSTDFDIINFDSEHLTEKILCVCPKCEQHCSVQSLWNHVSSCPVTTGYHCPACDIYLDKTTEQEHRFAHDAHRFSKDDFITIEYVNAEDLEDQGKPVIRVGSKRKLDAGAEGQISKRPKDLSLPDIYLEFYHCENCHFFLPKTGTIKKKSHMAGTCRAHIQRVCFTCGLVFTTNSIAEHQRLHENKKDFTFDNFKFFDLKSRQLSPPLPEYPQCRNCKCYFLQHSTAQRHPCPSKYAVTCTICNNKYSQMAYNLHMKFHGAKLSLNRAADQRCNRRIERLAAAKALRAKSEVSEENVKAVPKKHQDPERTSKDYSLFYCFECKVCFSGDSHKYLGTNCGKSVGMQYRKRTCEVCGVVLIIEKYKSHMLLHEKHNATIDDFVFFDMEKVRLSAPPVPTYFECKTCKVHFHTRTECKAHDCDPKAGQLCQVCKLKFSATALSLHAPFHKSNTKTSSRCLVYQCTKCTYVFSKHQAANRHSCAGPKKASSHRYCDVCHLNMYRQAYEQHLDKHDDMKIVPFDPNVSPPRPNAVTLYCGYCEIGYDRGIDGKKTTQRACPDCGNKLSAKKGAAQSVTPIPPKSKHAAKPLYTFHKCMLCKEAIRKREYMRTHMKTCGHKRKVVEPLKYCRVCDLHIKQKRYHCHLICHRRYPNLCKDTVSLIHCGKTQRKPFVVYTDAEMKRADSKARNKTRFTLYQCRNCAGVVTKIQRYRTHRCAEMDVVRLTNCRVCKLNVLLTGYEAHMKAHAQYPHMRPANIHIVPFGQKRGARSVVVDAEFAESSAEGRRSPFVDVEGDETSSEPSDGAKYTLYKCKKCKGCVTSELKAAMHSKQQPNCAKMKKNRCNLCNILLVKRFLRYHMERHARDPEFTKENMRFVDFGGASESRAPPPRVKFVLYQCPDCLVCSNEQYEHMCGNAERRTCDICRYDIEASHFTRHNECHKNDNYQRSSIRILPLDSMGDAESVSDKQELRKRRSGAALGRRKTVDVYKCSCGLHFLCRKSLEKHDFMCQGVAKETSGLPCSKCHLVFNASQLLKHSISHHGSLSYDIKYNVIASDSKADQCKNCHSEFMKGDVCPKCVTPKKMKQKICPKCGRAISVCNYSRHLLHHYKIDKLSGQKNTGNRYKKTYTNRTVTQHESGNNKTSNARRAPNKTGVTPNGDAKTMFKCSYCKVHFMNKDAYESHTKYRTKGLHVTPPKIKCKFCNLQIVQSDIAQHSLHYHSKEHHHNKGNPYRHSNILYHCHKCRVNFLTLSTLRRHLYRISDGGHEAVSSEPCPQCGLRFSRAGMNIHTTVHHDTHKLKREDLVLRNTRDETITVGENSDDGDGDTIQDLDSEHEETNENLGDDASLDESVDVIDAAVANELEDTASEASQIKTEGDAENADLDADALESNDDGESFKQSTVGAKKAPKGLSYYKCVQCNVHFLRYKLIQKHLTHHRPMPEYDFLECKLCKLNFKVNSLRTHMDHHRNKNFSLDQVRFFAFDKKIKPVTRGVDMGAGKIKKEADSVSEEGSQTNGVIDDIKWDANSAVSEENSQTHEVIDEIKGHANPSVSEENSQTNEVNNDIEWDANSTVSGENSQSHEANDEVIQHPNLSVSEERSRTPPSDDASTSDGILFKVLTDGR